METIASLLKSGRLAVVCVRERQEKAGNLKTKKKAESDKFKSSR